MTRQVLLLDIGADPLPELVPAAQVYGSWAPAVYQYPDVPVPAGFSATALADAVLLMWSPVPRATYIVDRAPDVAGAPGAWTEIERTTNLSLGAQVAPGTYWWRVRALVFGRSSAYSAQIKKAPTDMNAALSDINAELGIVSDAAADAAADAATALGELEDIADDNVLTPGEKPAVIRDYDVITAEQAGIDSEADAYRITTEKTTYDTAVSALTTYLGGLVAPVAWNDLGGNTNIAGATFRSKFSAVYGARQALFNAITTVLKARVAAAQGPNLACDYTFFNGPGRWISEQGDTDGLGNYSNGYLWLRHTATNNPNGGNCNFYEDNPFAANAGDVFFFQARAWNTYSTHAGRLAVRWFDGTGALVSVQTIAEWSAGQGPATQNATITAPAGVAGGQLTAYIVGSAVGDEFRLVQIYAERSNLLKSDSGAQLGGGRNQAVVTVGNLGAAWIGMTLSYTSTTISATITKSASTLQMGDDAIAYSAVSVSVSGSPGTTKVFYLYQDDPSYAGGSKSLVATATYQNTINSNGRLYVGKVTVTFPSSGTGSGSLPPRDCVHEMAWVVRRGADGQAERMHAREVVAGRDWLLQTDGTWRLVEIASRHWTRLVRARFACGHSLTGSRTMPLELADGTDLVDAPEAVGRQITYQRRGLASECVAVDDAGWGWVIHMYLSDGCFVAGDDPDHLFGHHNMKNYQDP